MSHRTRSIPRVVVLAAALTLASAATAKAPAPIVKAGKASGKAVVVTSKGLTLYRLKPETAAHLKCVGICTGAWPPLTVRTATTRVVAGPGITGKLSVFRRSDGKHLFQVALRGQPLYRFAADTQAGSAAGQGIKSFGGTWSAVTPK